MAYAYMWEFIVKNDRKMDFEDIYGPRGAWVQFFKRSDGFIKTELLHDSLNAARYVTIDYWKSEGDRNALVLKFTDEYHRLDLECAAYTDKESYSGEFAVTG